MIPRPHCSALVVLACLSSVVACSAAEPAASRREALAWEELSRLVPVDASEITQFGFSLDGDGARVAVGTPFTYGIDNREAGTVWIYRLEGGSYVEETRFRPFASREFLRFGWSVALDGDRAIAGMPGAFPEAAAILLRAPDGTWSEETRLSPSALGVGDEAGSRVGLSGEVAAVGSARHARGVDSEAGAVWIYRRDAAAAGGWLEERELSGSGTGAFGAFGASLDLEPIADGVRLIVGAPGESPPSGLGSGVVYVLERSGTGASATWTEVARLAPSVTTEGFGFSVALDGDRFVVGSKDEGGLAGAALVFARSTAGSWTEEERLAIPSVAGDQAGFSVALEGNRASVGAIGRTVSGRLEAGTVWIFERRAGAWVAEHTFTMPDAAARDALGTSLAMSGGRIYASATGDAHRAVDGFGSVLVLGGGAPAGTACTGAGTCASGVCIDGVCCATACGAGEGDCAACSVAAGGSRDGTCTAIARDTICRDAAGDCDQVERCDGASRACPTDLVETIGTECRAAASVCELVERCDGTSALCPPDGATIPGCCESAADCDDLDACTTDSCTIASRCAHAPIEGCVAGDAGPSDAGPPDAGAGSQDAGAQVDAGVGGDAGLVGRDAGDGTSASGCGCRVQARTAPLGLAAALTLALATFAARRRRPT